MTEDPARQDWLQRALGGLGPIGGAIPGLGALGGVGGAMGGILGGMGQMQQQTQAQLRQATQAWEMMNQRMASLPPPPIIGMDLEKAMQTAYARAGYTFHVENGKVNAIWRKTAKVADLTPAQATPAWERPTAVLVPETTLERDARFLREAQAELDELLPNATIDPPIMLTWRERVLVWLARLLRSWDWASV